MKKVIVLVFCVSLNNVFAHIFEKEESKQVLEHLDIKLYNLRFICPEPNGYFAHQECNKYWYCRYGYAEEKTCPESLFWNDKYKVCDWPQNVNCSSIVTSTTTTTTTTTTTATSSTTPTPKTTTTSTTTSTPITTTTSTTTPTPKTTTESSKFVCPEPNGYFAHQECNKYWYCRNGYAEEKTCPEKLFWNDKYKVCDRPENVNCYSIVTSTTTTTTTSTTTPTPKTTTESSKFVCPEHNGSFAHKECSKYWICYDWSAYEFTCPHEEAWNDTEKKCDKQSFENCSISVTSTTTTTTTTTSTTTPAPKTTTESSKFVCPERNGSFAHKECSKYWICYDWFPYEFTCPHEEAWNDLNKKCDKLSFENCFISEETAMTATGTITEQDFTSTEPEDETVTDPEFTTTTEPGERTSTQPSEFVCPQPSGAFAHKNCSKYWYCYDWFPYEFKCPHEEAWNDSKKTCDKQSFENCSISDKFVCPERNGAFAHKECSKYWICYDWLAYDFFCPEGEAWNDSKKNCDKQSHCLFWL